MPRYISIAHGQVHVTLCSTYFLSNENYKSVSINNDPTFKTVGSYMERYGIYGDLTLPKIAIIHP